MDGVEIKNFTTEFLHLWNAGHDARLSTELQVGKDPIHFQLQLDSHNDQAHFEFVQLLLILQIHSKQILLKLRTKRKLETGGSRENSGSGQGGFSNQDQTGAPSFNDSDAQVGLNGCDLLNWPAIKSTQ